MPYNNTPIRPSQEITGQTSLPLARIRKIIDADPDVVACSKNAAFVITTATEMFIQHLATQTHVVVKTEKKPRRNIQYKDVANAVARIDNLEFLSDVVPKTVPFKKVKEIRKGKESKEGEGKGKEKVNGDGESNGVEEVEDGPVKGAEEDEEGDGEVDVDEEEEADVVEEDEAEKMDVDEEEQVHARDDDPAAMQLEMEMRGPSPRKPSGGGFTAVNGRS